VKEGFQVLPYIGPDPVLARKLEDAGAAAVMPLAAPIGSNQGLRSGDILRIIIRQAGVPVVVDAGLGSPSDAALAMEMGADAVMVNTAVATAPDPAGMARAFNLAVQAGRLAFVGGLAPRREGAAASSPAEGQVR
jgi:thiazole synthase